MFNQQECRTAQDGFWQRLGRGVLRFASAARQAVSGRLWVRDGLRLCERELLVFPVAVTALTGLSFLFGGVCGAWQWWGCVVGVLAMGGVWARQWKVAAVAAGGFLLFLVGVWLVAGVVLDSLWMDTLVYHAPAIRMLIQGWNPIQAATVEAVMANPLPEAWDCRVWHLLAMPRGPWIFSAEAWFFTRAPFALFFPLYSFLFVPAAAQVWRLLRPTARWVRLLAVVVLWIGAPGALWQVTDGAVFFGGVGVLAVMGRSICERRTDWTALVVFTFWLLCGKQIGLITGLFFWLCFAGERLVHARGARLWVVGRFALAGSVVVALWGSVSVSPYWTMWRHYGHPLYPCYTADPERFPVHDIVGDFQRENADAAAMGHLGRFVNAYLSQRAAQAYYRLKLRQATFSPHNATWFQGGDEEHESHGPTNRELRLHFVAILALALLFGRWRERWLSLVVVLGMACVPTQMIGYARYVPWWTFLDLLGLIALAQAHERSRWIARLGLCGAGVLWWLRPVADIPLRVAAAIDDRYALEALLENAPPKVVYGYYSGGLFGSIEEIVAIVPIETTGHCFRTSLRNLRLLCEMEPRLANAQIQPLELLGDAREAYPLMPGNACRLLPQEAEPLVKNSLFRSNQQNPSRRERLCRYPTIFAQCFLVRLPALFYKHVQALFALGPSSPRGRP
ncbi:MAG: hypothetical protein ACI4QJ_02770 [Candidatus Spyradenecus sp.]